ncbi:MAG TPA: dienelactone hydrolase family protein [Acidimicrobiales bacterium]|nr:dienelactone hydrolase family protein [Acidimicrobiales bacterium]
METALRARRGVIGGAAFLLLAVVLASCGGGSTAAPAKRPVATGPFAVGVVTHTFVDTSRSTMAHGSAPAQPSRTLLTDTFYPATGQPGPTPHPDAPANAAAGPFPLVVYAHGSGGSKAETTALLASWAEAGYVVAAPEFPLTKFDTPGGSVIADYTNQPRDVSFIIDQLLREPPAGLAGMVDAARIGVSGLSLGGTTAMGVAFNSCCLDHRVKAAVVMAGIALPYPGGTYFAGTPSPPVLFIQGSADPTVAPGTAQSLYNQAKPPKALVTIVGGDHRSPYEGYQLTSQGQVVSRVTIGFLDRYLKGLADGTARLRQAVQSSNGMATLEESGL